MAHRPTASGHPGAGFTLVELMVVLGIIAMISGLAVGMMRRGDGGLGAEADARLVRSTLRLARNSAARSGTGAWVALEPETRSIAAVEVTSGGAWHFEDDGGPRGTRVDLGGVLVDGGVLGRALRLEGGDADLGDHGWQQPVHGFRFELWIAPEGDEGGRIVARESNFELVLEGDGSLVASVETGGPQGGPVGVETRPGVVQPGRFQQVALIHDGTEIRIEVGGVIYARRSESRPVRINTQGRLRIGGDGFTGLVDEARYDVAGEAATEQMGGNTVVAPDSTLRIRFDAQGRLDPSVHEKPVLIRLLADDGSEEPSEEIVRVELSGAIR